MDYLIILVFGWPAAILGAALLAGGIVFGRPALSVAGALATTGFCTYLMLTPTSLKWWVAVAVLCNYGSAVFVWRRSLRWAALLLLPYIWITVVVANAILSQHRTVIRSFGDTMWAIDWQHHQTPVRRIHRIVCNTDCQFSNARL